MPNKLFNNVHAGDTSKHKEGGATGKDTGDRGSQGNLRPNFQTGMDSEGNTEVQFGMQSPGPVRKK